MTVLVTGANGFLGSYLTRSLLQDGYAVRAIRRANSKLDLIQDIKDQIDWFEADLLDLLGLEDALQGVDQVFHCAAMVSFRPEEAKEMFQVNVDGTSNLLHAAQLNEVSRFLHISSIAALGRDPTQDTVHEKLPWVDSKLNSNYAKSKYEAEREVFRAEAEGLDVRMINPGVILGAGPWHSGTGRLFSRVSEGLGFYSTGSSGFVDVRDVAAAARFVMDLDEAEKRYITVSENWSYKRLLSQIALHLDKKAPGRALSPRALRWMARVEKLRSNIMGKKPDLTSENVKSVAYSFQYDNSLLQNAGFKFRPLEQTMEETSVAFKEGRNKF